MHAARLVIVRIAICNTTPLMHNREKTLCVGGFLSAGMKDVGPSFKEPLPQGCPPHGAADQAIPTAYRVVQSSNPTQTDFHSHALKGIPVSPTTGLCQASSCSLFVCKETVTALAQRMPKLRFPSAHVSTLSIPVGAGYSLIKKQKHVDFWMFKSFDPVAAVTSTVEA
jgi:hypothetical protein